MKTIRIQLEQSSLSDAIRTIEAYRDSLESKCAKIREDLAKSASESMSRAYSSALYAGNNDVTVNVESDDKSSVIKASGASLLFIEFGSGVAWPEAVHASVYHMPPHGTYGKQQGATGDPWVYSGVAGNLGTPVYGKPGRYWSTGNPPAYGIPAATDRIINDMKQVVEGAFR